MLQYKQRALGRLKLRLSMTLFGERIRALEVGTSF